MGYPFYHIPFGHLAGDVFDYQSVYNSIASGRKTIATTNAEALAGKQALEAGDIDFLALSGVFTLPWYGSNSISVVRTESTPAYIAPLVPGGAIIGTNPSSANQGNQLLLSGCTYLTIAGLRVRYAYRSATQAKTLWLTDATTNCRITGNYFDHCGGSPSDRMMEARYGSDDNRIDHNVFDATNGASYANNSFDGQIRVTAATFSGGVGTFTYVAEPSYPLTNGDTVFIRGFVQSEFNIVDQVISNVTSNTFQAPVSGSPSNVTTQAGFILEYWRAFVKHSSRRQPTGVIFDYNTFANISGDGTAINILYQDGNPRYGYWEESNNIARNNWCQNISRVEGYTLKGDNSTLTNTCGLGTAEINRRLGPSSVVTNCIMPDAGINIRGSDHSIKNLVVGNVTIKEWGALDGKNDGISALSSDYPETDNVSISRITIVDGKLEFGYREGYTPLVTDNPPTNIDMVDFVITASSGEAVDHASHVDGTYLSTNSITHDGFHYSLTGTAVAGYDSANKTTGAANFLGKFRPTSTTPSDITTGGEGSADTDAEGRPSFAGKGAIGLDTPSYLFDATFTGTAGVVISDAGSYTPDTNDTGSSIITPTISFTLDGNGAAQSASLDDANLINVSSEEQRTVTVFNAGGANNNIRSWLGTDNSLSTGYYCEVGPNSNYVGVFQAGNPTALWTVPFAMSGTADITITGIKTTGAFGDNLQWQVDGMPLITVTANGLTGTFVGFQQGQRVNSAGRVKSFSAETDSGAITTPTEPEIIFYTTCTGTSGDISGKTPDIGDSFSYFARTTGTHTINYSGGGVARPNQDGNSTHILLQLNVSDDLIANAEIAWTVPSHSGQEDDTYVAILRYQDANNFLAARVGGEGVTIYEMLSGSLTSQDTAAFTLTAGDQFIFGADDDGAYFLRNTVEIASYDSPNITDPPVAILFGTGNYLVSTDDSRFSMQFDELKYTQYPASVEIPATAPVFTTTPSVSGASDTSIVFQAATDIASKHYVAIHNTSSNYTVDDTGVGHIIAGQDPAGGSLTTTDSDTSVSAQEDPILTVTDLDDLDGSSPAKAPAVVFWGYTATASDDTEMAAPIIGEHTLPAPVSATFDEQNPGINDYQRVQYDDVSVLDSNGFVLTRWPDITDGSVVEVPYLSDGGYSVSLSSTGVISVDTEGNADSISGINMWDYDSRAWQEATDTGYTLNITTPYYTTIDALEFTNNTGTKTAAGTDILITLWEFGDSISVHNTSNAAFAGQTGTVESDNTVIIGHFVAGTHYVLITDTAGNKLWANQLVFS